MVGQVAVLIAGLLVGMQALILFLQLLNDPLVQLALLFLLFAILNVVEVDLVERFVGFFQLAVVDVEYQGGEDERHYHHVGTNGHNDLGQVVVITFVVGVGQEDQRAHRNEVE